MLECEQTRLRPPEARDLALLARLRNDLEIQLALASRPRPGPPSAVSDWVERRTRDPAGLLFVVAEIASDAALGWIQLTHIDAVSGHGRLGICLEAAARGRGHGQAAISLLERYAVDVHRLRKILLGALCSNEGAIRLYRRLGDTEVGVLQEHHYAAGRFHDLQLMEKLLGCLDR
jgi:RimJ/RimL family protein N-acetyltransferase